MSKQRTIAEIDGAVALSKRRQKIGKRPGTADRAAIRKAYHEDQLPKSLRDEIEELARTGR